MEENKGVDDNVSLRMPRALSTPMNPVRKVSYKERQGSFFLVIRVKEKKQRKYKETFVHTFVVMNKSNPDSPCKRDDEDVRRK